MDLKIHDLTKPMLFQLLTEAERQLQEAKIAVYAAQQIVLNIAIEIWLRTVLDIVEELEDDEGYLIVTVPIPNELDSLKDARDAIRRRLSILKERTNKHFKYLYRSEWLYPYEDELKNRVDALIETKEDALDGG